eukprot:285145-Prymnesium_polylepis.1
MPIVLSCSFGALANFLVFWLVLGEKMKQCVAASHSSRSEDGTAPPSLAQPEELPRWTPLRAGTTSAGASSTWRRCTSR